MRKTVKCARCKEEIEHREDLVASLIIFFLLPFHEHCYAKELKKYIWIRLPSIPINGNAWTANAFFGGLFGILMLLFAEGDMKWFGLLLIYPTIFRTLSYVLYERHLLG